MTRRIAVLLALVGAGSLGCALTSKSEPLSPRYFTAELPRSSSSTARAPHGAELRLGRVTASGYLAERIVYRTEDQELGFYEDRRWTERPEAFLRRALTQSLYEQAGLRRVVSGAAPTLDIELTGFEEVRGAHPVARARATMSLSDGRVVLSQQTLTVDLPIAQDAKGVAVEAAVRSMAQAMAQLVIQVTSHVVATLAAPSD
jgi:cholesterol transport system auxiliary component